MMPFVKRQFALIAAVIGALLVATAASAMFRAFLLPLWPGPPLYLNPLIMFAILLFGGVGVFTVLRAEDRGWPWFLAFVGLWVFVVAFEDSILQWFVFQVGIQLTGGRVNPIAIVASLAAVGAAILLHVNQLGRRLRDGFSDRGLDPRELAEVETRSRQVGTATVVRMVAIAGAAGGVLFLAEFLLGRARLGLNELGILGGILIVSVIVAMAFRVLRQGPLGVEVEPGTERPPSPPRSRPRGGLRGR